MAGPTFDPNGAVRFDLKSGTAADAKGARLVLVPSAALELLDAATLERLGTEIGRACGARVGSRLGGDAGVRSASLETVVSHLAGELAVAGVGALTIERWGRAMVAVVANPSVAEDAFLSGVLSAAVAAASGREIWSAALGRDRGMTRFYLGSRAGAEKARSLAAEGRPYVEIVGAVQGGPS